MTETTPIYNPKKAWLATGIVILVAVFAAMVTFRQMTVVPLMMEYFNVSVGTYGNMSALVSLTTLIGALASGPLQAKIGPRKLMIICLILFILSLGLQIIAGYMNFDFVTFMVLNVFGSIAYGAWMTAPPVIIAAWFPAEKRGLPNSISATWISFAMLIILVVSNPLVALSGDSSFGWINIWWMIFILMVIGLVLVLVFGKMPTAENDFMEKVPEGQPRAKMSDGLKNSGVWMLILMFLTFGFATAAFGNYFPTYLNAEVAQGGLGVDLEEANNLTSISTYVMVIVGFVWGFVLNKIPNRRYDLLMFIVILLTALSGIIMFILPNTAVIVPYMIFYGVISRLFPPVCFVIVPEICRSQEEVSVSVGILSVISNLIGTVATSICGSFVDIFGNWNSIVIPNIIFAIIGIIAGIALFPIYKKKFTMYRKERGYTS